MTYLRLDIAFLIAGFMGLVAGLPLVLMACCGAVLAARIVREDYLSFTYGAGAALALMAAFGPLVTFCIGIAMFVAGTILAYID